ncbi:MAG: hypothetical protein PHO07_11995, partial [Pirellulales bacterium]|nr:hypothetical protein [Pirellulales bacterium]
RGLFGRPGRGVYRLVRGGLWRGLFGRLGRGVCRLVRGGLWRGLFGRPGRGGSRYAECQCNGRCCQPHGRPAATIPSTVCGRGSEACQ